MNKLIEFMEKHFVPIAGKIGAQRHLSAVRDGFIVIMPLMIVGSLGVLLNNLPIPAYQNFMNSIFGGEIWKQFGSSLSQGTYNVMSLIVVVTIARSLAHSYNKDANTASAVAFAALVILMNPLKNQDGGNAGLSFATLGAQGLFISIFVALIATEIFVKLLGNKKLRISMPDGVPPAVSKSFEALIPASLTLCLFAILHVVFLAFGIQDIHDAFYQILQAPIASMANTIWTAIIIAILNHLFWFFGLNGGSVLEALMQTVYLPAIDANAAAVAAGKVPEFIVTKPFFDSFVYLGGSGATIGLILAVLLVGRKHKQYMLVSQLSIAPGIFNINEPVMFGFPLVLNPILFIPLVFGPVVLTVVSYFAIASGLVPKTMAMIPWTTPPILGGILSTGSWKGGVLALINLILSMLIYAPFVKIAEKQFIAGEVIETE